MIITNILKTQAEIDFTGRISIEHDHFKSLIFMHKGEIVQAYHGRVDGEKALFRIFNDIRRIRNESEISIFQEYEEVIQRKNTIKLIFSDILNKIYSELDSYDEVIEYIPSLNSNVYTKTSFIKGGEPLSQKEMSLLYTISKYPKLEDILDFAEGTDADILTSLINLKKKDAIE